MSFFDKLFRQIEPNVANKFEIPDKKYAERTGLTEFTVPDHIITIGSYAFENCKNLLSLKLPPSLRKIENNAFSGCTALTEINIPEGVKYIGNGAFSECSALKTIELPDSLDGTELSGGLFYSCTALETVRLPKTLTGNFGNVFAHCECLKKLDIPKGVTQIGAFTFEYCINLQKITIPDTVRDIGQLAFAYCESLRELYIPDSVETIKLLHTFRDCTALETLRIPVGVKLTAMHPDDKIEDAYACCFSGCTALKTVILGDRRFAPDGPLNDAQMQHFYEELAAEGNEKALQYIASKHEDDL